MTLVIPIFGLPGSCRPPLLLVSLRFGTGRDMGGSVPVDERRFFGVVNCALLWISDWLFPLRLGPHPDWCGRSPPNPRSMAVSMETLL